MHFFCSFLTYLHITLYAKNPILQILLLSYNLSFKIQSESFLQL